LITEVILSFYPIRLHSNAAVPLHCHRELLNSIVNQR